MRLKIKSESILNARVTRRAIGLVMLFCMTLGLSAARVDLRVDTPRGGVIGQGDMFQIYITVVDMNDTPSTPSNVPGASIKYFGLRSQSSSFVSTNGHTSQSTTMVYALTLKAEKKGTFRFGPVTVGGVKSNSVTYKIGNPTPKQQPQMQHGGGASVQDQDPNSQSPTFIGKGNEQLFLRANVSKTTAYEQEALVYTVKLYTTYNSIKFIGATDAPKFDNFVIEESKNISDQLTLETYNGKSYATAVIARYIIFPQMAGKLKIIGNKYTVSADAEEYYHDPFYSQITVRRPVQLHVTPNDLTIDVKALPLPKPVNFSGGVGHFTISSSIPSRNVIDHQAASVTYTVRGEGNLKYIQLPDLNEIYPDQIEVFSPTTDLNTQVGSSNVSGSVKFDYSFMPMETGSFEIPDVPLVYFNPTTGRYETAVAKGYTLSVARGSESSRSQAALAFSSGLEKNSGRLSKVYTPYVYNFYYWLFWFILPALILLIVVIVYRHHLAEQADIVALRSKKAAKMARRRLRRAAECLKVNNVDKFYDEMLRAVWGYLGDKLKLPTSELNRANVQQLLQEREIPSESQEKLIKLIDDCEFAKYSPSQTHEDMNLVYEEGVSTLDNLEGEFKKRKPSEKKEAPVADHNIDAVISGDAKTETSDNSDNSAK